MSQVISPSSPNLPEWPTTAVPPISSARLRVQPDDFAVVERMPITRSGSGEHAWLLLRKRGINTEQLAKQLARIAGVKRVDIGYAGLKDRHAVTTQWFSVRLPGRADPDWRAGLPAEVEVLDTTRHTRKLHTGALQGNDFVITLRACQADRSALAQRLLAISRGGVPNYFGEQRFGFQGDNILRARALFAGKQVRDAKLRGIYLSAARSFIFNEVLAERVRAGNWNRALAGEVYALNGSRSFFSASSPIRTMSDD